MSRVQLVGSAVLGAALIASIAGSTNAQEELGGSWWQVPAAPTGYTDAIAAWTGEEMLVVPTRSRDPVLTFDPLTSRWRTLTTAPRRLDPETPAIWMGRDLLLLSDQVGDEGPLRFRAGNGRWRDVRPYPSPISRIAAAVWTGDRVIAAAEDYGAVVEYDPRRNNWRALPRIPDAEIVRGLHWTGTHLLAELNDWTFDEGYSVAVFEPDSREWADPVEGPVPSGDAGQGIWIGGRLFYAWEEPFGRDSGQGTDIAVFEPSTGTWTHREDPCGLTTLQPTRTVAAGSLVVDLDNQRAYDPESEICYSLPEAPDGLRAHNALVWTGRDILTWSGSRGFEQPIARTGVAYGLPGWALDPAPGETLPLRLTASRVQNGVRLSMSLDRTPLVAGKPAWVTTRVRNVGRNAMWWFHDGCALATGVGGTLDEATWRPGQPVGPRDPTGLKWRATQWWGGGGPSIRLYFEPERYIGSGQIACSDIGIRDRIDPGEVITERHRWDGTASFRLGSPPNGRATISGRFGSFKRVGEKGPIDGTLEVSLRTVVVNGRSDDLLHPMEIVDAALEDASFAAFIDPIEIGSGSDHIIWFDPEMDIWEVGVFDYRSERFKVGLVDPRTGEVVDIIERPWREGEEPYP